MTVAERVVGVIVQQLGVDASEVTLLAKLRADLGADDQQLAALVAGLEEEFGIAIPDDDAWRLDSVRDVIQYIETHA
ncbi:MAG TPA: acyl carrier protein [Caldilineaceae bacterium]|nr:acyl carrier protein [Caldilineaceae bacterium]